MHICLQHSCVHTYFRIYTCISHTYTQILCNFYNPGTCWYPEIAPSSHMLICLQHTFVHTHFRIHTLISHAYSHILCNFFNPGTCWYPEIKTTFVFYVIPVRQNIIGMSWHLTSLHFKSHSPCTQMHAQRSHSPCPQMHVHSHTHVPAYSYCVLVHIDIFSCVTKLNLNTAQYCLLHCSLKQLETNWVVFWQIKRFMHFQNRHMNKFLRCHSLYQ